MLTYFRPSHRPMFLNLSGTLVGNSPSDLLAPLTIMYDESWNFPTHRMHTIRPEALKDMDHDASYIEPDRHDHIVSSSHDNGPSVQGVL